MRDIIQKREFADLKTGTPQILGALSLLLILGQLIFFMECGYCQEDTFTPRYDAISPEKKRPKKKATPQIDVKKSPPLYSMARYNLLFQEMCRLLEADARRDRVYRVSKEAVEEEQGCSSCRAFLRQMAQSCAPKAKLKKVDTPAPTPTITANPEGAQAGEIRSAASSDSIAEPSQIAPEISETPDVAITEPQPRRYPRTDLVDVVSRLSDELHDFGPGPGSVFDAVKSFESHLIGVPDLSPGERDYYGVLLSYMFSAWEGRPDSPLSAGTPSPDEIAELFQ